MVAEPRIERASGDGELDELWRAHHRYLLDVAYRMLGSVSEAEDVVQEAFTRLLKSDRAGIEDVRGWLVVVVSRLCLDQLRSARNRHEQYIGPWLPEPVIAAADGEDDPADRVTLDESVRMALLIVLERLSPAERAAFVLHDVFQFSFESIADITGRTPAACRQLASRARRHVQAETSPARFDVDPQALNQVAERFITAASNGDLAALMAVLDPNVTGHVDSGGVVPALRKVVSGREFIAPLFLKYLELRRITLLPMAINGEPGAIQLEDGRLTGVIAFSVRNGLITQVHAIANPHKLAHVAAALNLPAAPVGMPLSRGKRPSGEPPANSL